MKTRLISFLFASTIAALLFAPAQAATARAASGSYVDARVYLQGADLNAWYDLMRRLRANFDDVCGDTFCEGEFSNIEALRYVCSVERTTGRIGLCAWTFAASHEEVELATGEIGLQKGFWQCRTPLVPNTTVEELLAALAGNRPMFAPLPSSNRTIMDGLITDCFS
jgi:hypothetical protein